MHTIEFGFECDSEQLNNRGKTVMWDSLSQQGGMQKCSPVGYQLHGIAKLLGLGAFLLFLGIVIYLLYAAVFGGFRWSLCWLLAIPFATGIVAQALSMFGWSLAGKKGFNYDYEKREASWLENGKRVSYKA